MKKKTWRQSLNIVMKQRTLKLTLTLLTVFEALQLFCTFITTCCKRQSRWMWKSPKAQKLQVLSAMWGRMFLHPSVYKMRNLYKLPVPHYGTLIFICCNLFWQCLKKNYICFIAKKMSSYERKLLELCQTLKPFEETTLKVKKNVCEWYFSCSFLHIIKNTNENYGNYI